MTYVTPGTASYINDLLLRRTAFGSTSKINESRDWSSERRSRRAVARARNQYNTYNLTSTNILLK